MPDYYDPRKPWTPPERSGARVRQSTLSIAMEALAGGLVIALVIAGVKWMLGL